MILTDESGARAWLKQLPEWDGAAEQRLVTLVAMLAEENGRQNLVSAASLDSVWLRHIADSAQLLPYVPRETGGSWLDLGTGAGFPGLVIAALRPELRVVMVESRGRRVEWLERVRIALGLDNAQICGMRVEVLPDETFSAISARAFAPLPKLLELSARFSTSDTRWLLPKGRSARQELAELTGWRHAFHVEQSLTDPDAGVLVGTLAGRKGNKP
ncbi:MAG: rRNA ((527)-N(7))-methyltransferase RsmG [Pseudomonadota bacterium]|jgi:16S rRNA (guanine527-N7)-methyltransferase